MLEVAFRLCNVVRAEMFELLQYIEIGSEQSSPSVMEKTISVYQIFTVAPVTLLHCTLCIMTNLTSII